MDINSWSREKIFRDLHDSCACVCVRSSRARIVDSIDYIHILMKGWWRGLFAAYIVLSFVFNTHIFYHLFSASWFFHRIVSVEDKTDCFLVSCTIIPSSFVFYFYNHTVSLGFVFFVWLYRASRIYYMLNKIVPCLLSVCKIVERPSIRSGGCGCVYYLRYFRSDRPVRFSDR